MLRVRGSGTTSGSIGDVCLIELRNWLTSYTNRDNEDEHATQDWNIPIDTTGLVWRVKPKEEKSLENEAHHIGRR